MKEFKIEFWTVKPGQRGGTLGEVFHELHGSLKEAIEQWEKARALNEYIVIKEVKRKPCYESRVRRK